MTQTLESPPANGNGQTELARRSFDPHSPIGTPGALKSLLDAQRNGIAQALPKHITPERIIKTLLVAANRNPDILKCTQASILETINRAAELGLDLSGTLGEAYPVPFNNKVRGDGREWWEMQLTLIIGYRGLEKLAWQSGEVEFIDAEVVCINDSFTFKKGTEVLVEWSPKLDGDRGEPIGAYACVKMKSGGRMARFLPKSDIEKIRNSAKSKDSPAWRNWWDEMARKCVLKRTLKDAPLSTEKFVKALEQDEADYELTDVLSAETTARAPNARTKALAARIAAQTEVPHPTAEGQTIDTSSADPASADEGQKQETTEQQPASELLTQQGFADAMNAVAQKNGIDPETADKAIVNALKLHGYFNKPAKMATPECQKWMGEQITLANEGRFFSTKK